MDLVARVDDYGKPAWIALMILSFIVFWPIGLAILAFLLWSGRMGCWKHGGRGRWHYEGTDREPRGPEAWFRGRRRSRSSGNMAFDEYREETLRRLEEEQQEFHDFLRQLRQAKDKAEFDQFMADRRRRRAEPDTPEAPEGRPMPEGPAPQPQV